MDDGAGSCQPVCSGKRPCITGYYADGAMVSGDLRGLFVVLGVAGEGGEPDFPHHRGDGAISARDGAVFVYFRTDGNAGLGQCTTHTTLREPQNIFRQTVRRIHIRPGYGSPACGSGNLPAPAPSASRPLPDHPLQVWSAAHV